MMMTMMAMLMLMRVCVRDIAFMRRHKQVRSPRQVSYAQQVAPTQLQLEQQHKLQKEQVRNVQNLTILPGWFHHYYCY